MNKNKNTRSPIDPPTIEELSCLIGWPKGSNGETNELNAIKTYMNLCKKNGWGRMTQLANAIDDIWRNPGNDKIYQKQQAKHFKLLKWPPYQFEDTEDTEDTDDNNG